MMTAIIMMMVWRIEGEEEEEKEGRTVNKKATEKKESRKNTGK